MKPWWSIVVLCALAGLLAGCASGEPLARAHGPIFALNAGLWHPTPEQLHTLPRVPQP
ncbi:MULTISPECIES: type IV secretion system lipoprotein VirB7 [Acidiphilium]|uniref:type IV secretion system lipoprotein VirB7 n=1 Tax=Acidiphilium TaxID=522 RepID=UPI00257A0DC3|nr:MULTISPECIES: type IV secretion system lipoprotein VirB7 [Acidiphilium]HQT84929.1 type IV secretion system lipoprotein VirB7 [Acidiphilium rubrum]